MSDPFKDADATIGSSNDPAVTFWRKEIHLAHKRENKFQKDARRITQLYEGDKRDENSFNILFSNTQTLLPAVYNQVPRPFVDRRFKDPDPIGKESAKCLERTLAALEDSGDAEYESFDGLLEQAVLGALVPGRGFTKFRYEAEIKGSKAAVDGKQELKSDDGENKTDSGEGNSTEAGPGENPLTVPKDSERVGYETVCGDDIDYDKCLFGFARRWRRMPWVAHIHFMEEEDVKASFGETIAKEMIYNDQAKKTDGWKVTKNPNTEEEPGEDVQKGSRPVATVYEIWHKEKKCVLFYTPDHPKGILETVPDPYGLSGFYPFPEPLRFIPKRSKLTPTPLYILYEEQAKELNRLTQRINRLLHAIKVRGVYDATIPNIKELLNSDDNTLLPARNVPALSESGGLEKAFMFVPIKDLIVALQQLLPAREVVKNTIYEITGIADIMRGDTQASETATAQNIKNMYGTLKLNKYRKRVQDYARESLRIMGELAAKHFSVKTFQEMTNLDYSTDQDIKIANQIMQRAQQMQLQMQMQPPQPQLPAPGAPPGQPPAPPQPPQLPPQVQQMVQQAQAVLAKPAWSAVVSLFREDLTRYYRIDIETNSTVASDTQEDKENIMEVLGVIGQLFDKLTPAAQNGVMPMPAVKSLVLATVRRFQFGREVEDAVSQMPDQLPPPPPPPGTPSPAEQQALEAKAQQQAQESQLKMQADQRNAEREAAEHQQKMSQMGQEAQMAQAKHALDMATTQADIAKQGIEVQTAEKLAVLKLQLAQVELEIKQHERATKAADSQLRQHEATIKQSQALVAKKDANAHKPKPTETPADPRVDKLEKTVAEMSTGSKQPRKISVTRGPDGKMAELVIH